MFHLRNYNDEVYHKQLHSVTYGCSKIQDIITKYGVTKELKHDLILLWYEDYMLEVFPYKYFNIG